MNCRLKQGIIPARGTLNVQEHRHLISFCGLCGSRNTVGYADVRQDNPSTHTISPWPSIVIYAVAESGLLLCVPGRALLYCSTAPALGEGGGGGKTLSYCTVPYSRAHLRPHLMHNRSLLILIDGKTSVRSPSVKSTVHYGRFPHIFHSQGFGFWSVLLLCP